MALISADKVEVGHCQFMGSCGCSCVSMGEFSCPVHWTEKMTETELNPTAKEWHKGQMVFVTR